MSKEHPKLDEVGNKNPFKVPEGYFGQLNEQLLQQLDATATETPQQVNMWARVKPWVYLAAMFAGIALMFNIFNTSLPTGNKEDRFANSLQKSIYEPVILEEEDYDDYYDYLEHQAIEQNYREAVFISEY